jgi:hypothetical protein
MIRPVIVLPCGMAAYFISEYAVSNEWDFRRPPTLVPRHLEVLATCREQNSLTATVDAK